MISRGKGNMVGNFAGCEGWIWCVCVYIYIYIQRINKKYKICFIMELSLSRLIKQSTRLHSKIMTDIYKHFANIFQL